MILKKGNADELEFSFTGKNKLPLDDLADTTDIIFVVKTNKTDTDASALISKAKSDMTIDDPVTGSIIIPITSSDSNIAVGDYYMGLQLVYSAEKQIEMEMKNEVFTIEQDTVRGS